MRPSDKEGVPTPVPTPLIFAYASLRNLRLLEPARPGGAAALAFDLPWPEARKVSSNSAAGAEARHSGRVPPALRGPAGELVGGQAG